MKRLLRVCCATATMFFLGILSAHAATYVSRATGNWNATGTWAELRTGTITTSTASTTVNGAGTTFTTQLAVGNILYRADGAAIGTVQTITNNTTLTLTANAASSNTGIPYYRGATATPVAGDTATANSPHTVTVSAAAAAASLTINSGAILTQTAATLTLTGTLTVNGTHTCGNSVTVTGLTSIGGLLNITTTTGTKAFNGSVDINSGGTFRNNTVAEAVTIGGNLTNDGTFTSGTGTYTFNAAGNWDGANTIAFGGGVAVTAARTNNATVTVAGTLAITGAITLTNNASVDAAGAITGSVVGSTWTNAANSTLLVGGALLATGTLNAAASGNTVNYDGTGAQTIKLPAAGYFHLTASNGNTKTLPAGTVDVGGNLTIATSTTLTANTSDPFVNVTGNMAINGTGVYQSSNNAARTLAITGNLSISGTYTGNGSPTNLSGNFTHDGTFTSGSGAFTFTGTATQLLDGTATNTTFTTMGMSNTAAFADRKLTLSHDITVTTLNFSAAADTGGRIITGANKVIVPTGGAINNATGSATESDFVAGRLQRFVAAGASTVVFPVGTDGAALPDAGYSPASLAFSGVGVGGGALIVSATQSDHPNIATSGLDFTKSVNRYWTLTTTGVSGTALPAFTNYAATLTFIGGVAPSGDLDSSANTANFEMERWTGAAWDTTTVGTRTATTTTATETALGDLAVAEKKVIIPDPGDFNVFETTTGAGAITGKVFTKLVGADFSLDVVAILAGVQQASFTSTVTVDLVTGSTGGLNCPGTPAQITGTSRDVNLTAGRGSTGVFNIADTAYRDVRVRVRYPTSSPTVTSCSTDNFAIRPTGLTVTSTNASGGTAATNTATTGTPAIKTGANFNLRATALPGYNGTPSINNTLVAGTPTAGSIGGSFSAAPIGTGIADGNAFYYSEVGHFGLATNAVFDNGFTSVDSGGGDCTNDFSNTSVGGRYGCNFGSTAVPQATGVSGFGRFIPDNFNVSYNVPVFAPACGPFTYVGQVFNYSTAPVMTITARSGSNNGLTNTTTVNYAGSYMKFTNASLAPVAYDTQGERYQRFDAIGGGATPALDVSQLPATTADPVIGTFSDGVGTLTFSSGSGFSFTRSATTPSAAFDADIALALNVIDGDGVTFAANPASFGSAAAGAGMLFSDANVSTTNDKSVRYGRLRIGGASGSQLLPLRLPVEAQYWNGSVFVTNTLDSCTTLDALNVGLGNRIPALTGPNPTASIVNSPLQSGRSAVRLSAPGTNNQGSVDVTLNLGAGANADACNALAPAATAGNKSHLRGAWCSPPGTYSKDPAARARFGINRGSDQSIYRREQ